MTMNVTVTVTNNYDWYCDYDHNYDSQITLYDGTFKGISGPVVAVSHLISAKKVSKAVDRVQ